MFNSFVNHNFRSAAMAIDIFRSLKLDFWGRYVAYVCKHYNLYWFFYDSLDFEKVECVSYQYAPVIETAMIRCHTQQILIDYQLCLQKVEHVC